MSNERVEFTLSMPGRASWNGQWSGDDRHYAIVETLSQKHRDKIGMKDGKGYWSHRWSDGWCAGVTARVIPKGERRKKSNGFCGYDWMVRTICIYGKIMDEQAVREHHKQLAEAQP